MERQLDVATTDRAGREPSSVREKIPKMGFWDKMLIVLIMGAILGVAGSRAYYERRLEEAIKLQRFIHKNVIYEIREANPAPGQ